MRCTTLGKYLPTVVPTAIFLVPFFSSSAFSAQLYNDYKYPWAANETEWYVTQTWHGSSSSFSYKGKSYSWEANTAIDFQAVDNLPSNGVNVLAPADAEVAYICTDANNQAAISLVTKINGTLSNESIGIVHLEADSLTVGQGDSVQQGDILGKVYNQDLWENAGCGYGARNHLHVRFPTKNPSFTIDGDTYFGNDDSFLGDLVNSSNTSDGEPPPAQDVQLSRLDKLVNQTCNDSICSLIELNLDELYFGNDITDSTEVDEFDFFTGIYAVEAFPLGSNGNTYNTSSFNLRGGPGYSQVLGSLPWGSQGKLLSTSPTTASLGGIQYNWWEVDFIDYGKGWVAGDFMYQRFHNYRYFHMAFTHAALGITDDGDIQYFTEQPVQTPESSSSTGLVALALSSVIYFRIKRNQD